MFQFDTIAITLLCSAVVAEFVFTLLHRPQKNVVQDTKANFVLGCCVIFIGIFIKMISFALFSLAYSIAIFKPNISLWLWITGFFSCDFINYVYHFIGHKTRLFWAAHITHHSSMFFNLSVGLRTNFIHLFYRFLFWTPLCFLGIPPAMVLLFESINAIHNFILHTEKVGKLGVLDWIFNTPSNHRVHHASNPQYLDKNLGGMLMIFDHLFGTYAREKEQPVYGITHNINTTNPVKILLQEYKNVNADVTKQQNLLSKIRYLFSKPE